MAEALARGGKDYMKFRERADEWCRTEGEWQAAAERNHSTMYGMLLEGLRDAGGKVFVAGSRHSPSIEGVC